MMPSRSTERAENSAAATVQTDAAGHTRGEHGKDHVLPLTGKHGRQAFRPPAHWFNLDRLPVSCVLGPRTRPPPAHPDDSTQESTSSGQKRFKIGAISIATENWGGLGTYQTAQSASAQCRQRIILSKQEYGAILKPHGGCPFAQFHLRSRVTLLTTAGVVNIAPSTKTVL